MALKTLGQVVPGVGATVNLYQVPVGKASVLANIIACNIHAANADSIIIYQDKDGLGPSGVGNGQVLFKQSIPPGESFVTVAGIALAAGEAIHVYSANGTTTFTTSGDES